MTDTICCKIWEVLAVRECKFGKIISVFLGAVALTLGIAAALVAGRTESLLELAPGVYFREGDIEHQGHCNNGIVIFRDFVVVIDGNFPSGAEACLADIRGITDKPVRIVFDSHHHGDHAYGNPVWTANGAITVAHENVVQEMNRYEPHRWQETSGQRQDVNDLGLKMPETPIVTYPDRLVIDDGTQRLELLYFGTAHTRGDGFAYLPRHRILFSGDAVVNGPYNYMGDGDTYSWIGVIEELERLQVETVAPGHGTPMNRSLLAKQKSFIQALHLEVEKGLLDGKGLEELQDSIQLPDSVQLYVGKHFRDQVKKVYDEKIVR